MEFREYYTIYNKKSSLHKLYNKIAKRDGFTSLSSVKFRENNN